MISRVTCARFAAILGGIVLLSCAPAEHTPEPYRSDPVAAAALTLRATEACVLSGANDGVQPVRAFVTDGCSRFVDAEWSLPCCVEHDIAYWCGGDRRARREADAAFGRCVAESANGFMAWLMESGVRIGGHPVFPSSYRWGYGHLYRAGYPSAGGEP